MSIFEKPYVTEEEAKMVISFALMMAESLLEDDFEDPEGVLKLSSTALETVPSCGTIVFGLCRSGMLSAKEALVTCLEQLKEGYEKVTDPEYARLDDPSDEYLVLLKLVEDDN